MEVPILPDDIQSFLCELTSYRYEVNSGTPNEWGVSVRDEAQHAAKLCDKYGIVYIKDFEWDQEQRLSRAIYSDGTKGEWE